MLGMLVVVIASSWVVESSPYWVEDRLFSALRLRDAICAALRPPNWVDDRADTSPPLRLLSVVELSEAIWVEVRPVN